VFHFKHPNLASKIEEAKRRKKQKAEEAKCKSRNEAKCRSFLKLKLIKTYFRSSMSQERFNCLTTLSIAKDVLENIGLEETAIL